MLKLRARAMDHHLEDTATAVIEGRVVFSAERPAGGRARID